MNEPGLAQPGWRFKCRQALLLFMACQACAEGRDKECREATLEKTVDPHIRRLRCCCPVNATVLYQVDP